MNYSSLKVGRREMPLCIEFSFAYISGKLIAFWEESSMLRHSGMAEEWLTKNVPAFRSLDTRTNSTNFGHLIRWLGERT